jgi:cytochrome c biogenesis protein CcdA
VRIVGALVLVAAGVTLVAPRVQAAFTSVTEPLVRGGNRVLGRVSGRGAGGQFVIGALLGLVWTPCVGPTLGVAIASASQGKDLVSAFFVFLFFGLGVATALMAIAYGSRRALSGHKATFQAIARWSKPGLGILLILISILIVSGLDRVIEAALVGLMPDWLIGITVGI